MHVHFLDPYRPGRSLVHQVDPRVKLVLTVGLILGISLTPPGAWAVYLLSLSLVLAEAILSDVGVGYVLKRAFLALPFVLAAVPLLVTIPGPALLVLPVGSWRLVISQPGLVRFVSIALKSWISVQAAILLTATTPFPDLLLALRALRLPRILVAIIGLMWRYLFVLVDEALRLLRARSARSGVSPSAQGRTGGSLPWRARVAGGMAGSLFLRAYERSDRIYVAMLARGYDGESRSLPFPRLSRGQRLVLYGGLFVLALLVGLGLIMQTG